MDLEEQSSIKTHSHMLQVQNEFLQKFLDEVSFLMFVTFRNRQLNFFWQEANITTIDLTTACRTVELKKKLNTKSHEIESLGLEIEHQKASVEIEITKLSGKIFDLKWGSNLTFISPENGRKLKEFSDKLNEKYRNLQNHLSVTLEKKNADIKYGLGFGSELSKNDKRVVVVRRDLSGLEEKHSELMKSLNDFSTDELISSDREAAITICKNVEKFNSVLPVPFFYQIKHFLAKLRTNEEL